MTSKGGPMSLFPPENGGRSGESPSNVFEARGTGVLPYQRLLAMANRGLIKGQDIEPGQFQPASLDLRLGRRAYRVVASFLPGPGATVMERVKELDGLPAIDLAAPG